MLAGVDAVAIVLPQDAVAGRSLKSSIVLLIHQGHLVLMREAADLFVP